MSRTISSASPALNANTLSGDYQALPQRIVRPISFMNDLECRLINAQAMARARGETIRRLQCENDRLRRDSEILDWIASLRGIQPEGGGRVKVMAFDRPVVVDGALRGYDRVQVLVSDGGHEIDEEIVPGGIAALSACGGDVSGWVSKFAPFTREGLKL